MKRKQTTKQRLFGERERADALDARRREQIANQVQSINRLLAVNGLLMDFIEAEGLQEKWDAFREKEIAAAIARNAASAGNDETSSRRDEPESPSTGDER